MYLSNKLLKFLLNCKDVVGITRKNWKKLEDYQGRWRKFWIKIKRNFRGMDYFCGINNLNKMDQSKANIKEKMKSK